MLVSRPRPTAHAFGVSGVTAIAVSLGGMVVLGALGPSATQPRYGPPSVAPPWFVPVHPPALLVYITVIATLVVGAGGVGAALIATRRGWSPSPAKLLAGGTMATIVLLLVPSMGSTDVLHYAASGRIASLGADPYSMTPVELAHAGDPVGRHAMADMWRSLPSNYGPLATATQWMASTLGGTSTLRTVWWIAVFNGVGFVATGLLLDRLVRPEPTRRVRAQLAWSLNPVLLWHLVVGAHIDGLAVTAAVAAFAALTLPRSVILSGGLAGAGIAAACATKISYVVLVPGLVWALRRDKRRLAASAVGGCAVAVATYAPFPQALIVPLEEGTRVMGASSWAPFLDGLLNTSLSASGAKLLVAFAAALAFAVLAVVLARGLPPAYRDNLAAHAARPTVVILAAWLLTTPHAAPWYDAMAWALVPLLPACWFAPALLAHTTLLSLGYLYIPTGGPPEPRWIAELGSIDALHYIIPLGLATLTLAVGVLALRGTKRRRRPPRSPSRLGVPVAEPPAGE